MQNKKRPELPAQPMRSAPRDGKAAQGQEARRSGQLARLTEEIRAGGRSDCCDDAAFVGGDRKQSPQQPWSRSLYQTGRVRLPGGPGLDGTCRPGRRRAEARYVRRRGSFSGLLKDGWPVDPGRPAKFIRPICGEPCDDLVVFFDSKGLALADAGKEPPICRTEAADGGFVQLAGGAVSADKLQQV